MLDRHHYSFIILLLLATVFISWGYYFYDYHHQDTIKVNDFPRTIDNWTSEDLPIDKADQDILETKNAFLRCYTDFRGRHIFLYIAYSQSNPKAANPPELYYKASGISIIDKGKKLIIIASSNVKFKVNWLLLDNNESQQLAYYWFKVGDIYTQSYWKQQILAAFNNILGRRKGNALIRISTDIDNGHHQQAIDLLNEFACLIIPQLLQNLP